MKRFGAYILISIVATAVGFTVGGRLITPIGAPHSWTESDGSISDGYFMNQVNLDFAQGAIPVWIGLALTITSALIWMRLRQLPRWQIVLSASFFGLAIAFVSWHIAWNKMFADAPSVVQGEQELPSQSRPPENVASSTSKTGRNEM